MSLESLAQAGMERIVGNALEADGKEVEEQVPAAVQAVIMKGIARWRLIHRLTGLGRPE